MKRICFIICLLAVTTDIIDAQSIIYVNNVDGFDINNGTTPTSTGVAGTGPKKTIVGAISAVSPGGIVYIAATGYPYIESPVVNKVVNFIGYSVFSSSEFVQIKIASGDMIFNIPGGGNALFMVASVGSFPAAAGFKFSGTASSGFYFQNGQVIQINTDFIINFPFRCR